MTSAPHTGDRATRAYLAGAALMAALIVAMAPAALIDERTLWDVNVWWKPLKFAVSLLVHLTTLALLAQLLAPRTRGGLVMTGAAYLVLASAIMEIVYIAIQAARGRHSHFNFDTPFEANMYSVMGAGALLLVLGPLAMGLLLAAQRDGDRSGLKLGAVLGLTVGPLFTIAFAGYMATVAASHWVGASVSDAGGVPVFGWSREVGDLRPAHFVATHMIQALPVIGFIADRLARGVARPAVIAGALALAGLSTALFLQALAGQPILPR